MTKLITLIFACAICCGCAGPVQQSLWQPLPQAIELSAPVAFHSRGVGDVTLPKGTYHYWYKNKFGYYYRNDERPIELKFGNLVGGERIRKFPGGIWLSNRAPKMMVYELKTNAEWSKSVGNVADLAAMENGDKDGLARVFSGVVPVEVVAQMGLKP